MLSSSAADCLKEALRALAAGGALDKAKVASVASTLSTLKRATLVGGLLRAYDVEWRVLDVLVDTRIVGGAGPLGNGFSVAAKHQPPSLRFVPLILFRP